MTKRADMPEPAAIEQPSDLTLLQNQQVLDKKLEYINRNLNLQAKQLKDLQTELDKLKAAHPPFTEDEEPIDVDGDDEDDDIDNPLAKKPARKPRGRK